MAWTLLFVGGLLEICWAIGPQSSEGFTRIWPTVETLVAMAAPLGCLAQALKTIPVAQAMPSGPASEQHRSARRHPLRGVCLNHQNHFPCLYPVRHYLAAAVPEGPHAITSA